MSSTLIPIFRLLFHFLFFFNDPATTEIYTLSLHDALPISLRAQKSPKDAAFSTPQALHEFCRARQQLLILRGRSEEHTSELQSRRDLVCRLLLEKKKKNKLTYTIGQNCTPRKRAIQQNSRL